MLKYPQIIIYPSFTTAYK